jgi:hypothetical protein
MAGDWIPMRLNLASDPAVIGVAAATGLDEFGVIGRLHRLWGWANEHTTNGHAASVTENWIDRYVSVTGFAKAMADEGWLTIHPGRGVTFPRFDEWNSKGAKQRLLAAKRKRKQRVDDPPDVTEVSRSQRDKSVTTEEKRREEDKTPQSPPAGGGAVAGSKPKTPRRPKTDAEADPRFLRFWSKYPRPAKKPDAAKVFARIDPSSELLETIMAAVKDQQRPGGALEPRTAADGRSVVPYPTTWLNQRRWEESAPAAQTPPAYETADEVRERERRRLDAINSNDVPNRYADWQPKEP